MMMNVPEYCRSWAQEAGLSDEAIEEFVFATTAFPPGGFSPYRDPTAPVDYTGGAIYASRGLMEMIKDAGIRREIAKVSTAGEECYSYFGDMDVLWFVER